MFQKDTGRVGRHRFRSQKSPTSTEISAELGQNGVDTVIPPSSTKRLYITKYYRRKEEGRKLRKALPE
jgi:hypothetical protein